MVRGRAEWHEPAAAPEHGAVARWGSWLLVGGAVAWNLLNLRAETYAVAYLDDSSVHEQMVRFATSQLRDGHLPLTSWFPFLGLGSPQFLHYQSLPAMLAGLLGLAVGPDAAFRWTLYLLLSLWPISVYCAARLFGAGGPSAGATAAMSPFLVSSTGIGYEHTLTCGSGSESGRSYGHPGRCRWPGGFAGGRFVTVATYSQRSRLCPLPSRCILKPAT